MNKFLGALIASAFLLTGTAFADQAKTSTHKVAQATATAKPAAKKPAAKPAAKPAPKATKKPAAMKPAPKKT